MNRKVEVRAAVVSDDLQEDRLRRAERSRPFPIFGLYPFVLYEETQHPGLGFAIRTIHVRHLLWAAG
jgi:hypothetical protein